MLISDLLSPELIRCDVHAGSKKRLLEMISEQLATSSDEFTQREIFESLNARERLGSTGLGHGVAIPHGRVRGAQNVTASFFRLAKPLPFDAVDGQPVDLLFALAVPEDCGEDHLKLLAHIAELFSDDDLLKELRSADSAVELLKLLSRTPH